MKTLIYAAPAVKGLRDDFQTCTCSIYGDFPNLISSICIISNKTDVHLLYILNQSYFTHHFSQIDAMFAVEDNVGDDSRFEKTHHDALHCAHAGPSMMMRKDNLPKYAWMEEGLEKIKENGDYDWSCNNAERGESGAQIPSVKAII